MGVWLAELRKNLPSDVVLHFVGTKADLAAQGHREVPFERCIAFVADSLAPGQGGTPPPSAIASSAPPPPFSSAASMLLMQHHYLGASSGSLSGGAPATPGTGVTPLAAAAASLLGRDGAGIAGMEPRSPSSKRSSGFWTQEAGWDACHEVSAESGEGVDEVFGVVTRKLVEQDRRMKQALQAAAATPQYPERFDSGSGGLASGAGAGNRAGGGPAGLTPGGQQVAGDYFAGANPRGSFRVGRDRRSWLFSPGFTPSVSVTGANGDDGGARYGEEVDYAQNRKRCCH